MKRTWQFYAGLVAGFLLITAIYATAFFLNLGVPTQSSQWCFEIDQKKAALAAKITTPKILLIGGSGTLFGINAQEIQEQTGHPCVNLGDWALLGADYMLYKTKRIAKPGDTVLLSFEYEVYNTDKVDPASADLGFVDFVIARDTTFIRTLNLADQWKLFMLTSRQRLKKGLQNRGRTERFPGWVTVYDVSFVDDWGDETHNTRSNRVATTLSHVQDDNAILASGLRAHPPVFDSIAAFCQWAKENNVQVLATYPNLCDKPEYHTPIARLTAQRIHDLFSGLQVPVLGHYTDSLLPPDDFFDSHYHLTTEASRLRTQRLIVELNPFLK